MTSLEEAYQKPAGTQWWSLSSYILHEYFVKVPLQGSPCLVANAACHSLVSGNSVHSE